MTARAATLGAGWAAGGALWLVFAAWVALHPVAPGSDDALFLVRGLSRFSVLEFRPQFPGYPGMIAMGRAVMPVTASPEAALALLSALIALAIPPVAALAAIRVAGRWAALAAFVGAMVQPLMPDLALSRLTDGAGLLFTLAALALLPRAFWAGVALGWAAACRPSDAVLILSVAAGALAARPALARGLTLGFGVVILPTAAFLLIAEPLYIREGLRFIAGHATIWGNTPFSDAPRPEGWGEAIATIPGGAPLLIVLTLAALPALGPGPVARRAAAFGFVGHALWTWAFQNPESLRHLSPLLVLGPVILAMHVTNPAARAGIGAAVLLGAMSLAATLTPDPRGPAPLQAIAERFHGTGAVLSTNEGVSLLRAALPATRVFDQHYAGDAALGLRLAKGPAYRISYTTLPGRALRHVFRRRFVGEHTLYLYAPQINGRFSGQSEVVSPTFASASG